MDSLVITKHAYQRAKERLGWKRSTTRRMSKKALEEGSSHSDANGRLLKYLNGLYLEYENANNIKIYGEDVFLFKNNTLITIYRLPQRLIGHLKVLKK